MDKTNSPVALVTGGNSGLGFEISRGLARRGLKVILTSRSADKGQAALARLKAEFPQASFDLRALDLADLDSVKALSNALTADYGHLDLLFNNAGIMAVPFALSRQGFESQMATNHWGPFALTLRLLPLLEAAAAPRIVTTSSFLHRSGVIGFDTLDDPATYKPWTAYSQSKLANLLFTYELQRRLRASGSKILALACHPGYAATNLQHVGPALAGNPVMGFFTRLGNSLMAQSAEAGAWSSLQAGFDTSLQGGEYLGPVGWGGMRGKVEVVRSSPASYDLEVARRLWEESERRTGVKRPG